MGLCHTAAILSRETKGALFLLSSLAPKFFTARLSVVKQSFFSLSGQYGRHVNKAHVSIWQLRLHIIKILKHSIVLINTCHQPNFNLRHLLQRTVTSSITSVLLIQRFRRLCECWSSRFAELKVRDNVLMSSGLYISTRPLKIYGSAWSRKWKLSFQKIRPIRSGLKGILLLLP